MSQEEVPSNHREQALAQPGSTDAEHFWEQLYGQREQIWSGNANAVLAEVAETLQPGTALDLGCGEGGDTIWLAQRGWHITAVDISATALRRVTARAAAICVANRVICERHDLAVSFPSGRFDLVSAQYLQSPLDFPRATVLQRAAGAVAQDGLLLIVEHSSTAPWSWNQGPNLRFPSPEQTLSTLELVAEEWQTVRLEALDRQATGPNGEIATVKDNIIALRRLR